ncbi:hypothetical protein PC114_g21077 [Phytophthora cactorum]|nr:hypothetical protein PC114_g21077 [Phytophthora cactorum]
MRPYRLLFGTAAALLATSGDVADAATCRYRTLAPSTSTITEAPGISPASSFSFDNLNPSSPGVDASAEGTEQQTTDATETPVDQTTTDAPATPDSSATTDLTATDSSAATAASTTTDTPPSGTDASAAAAPSAASNSSTTTTSSDNSKLCAKPRVRITEVDLGVTVDANEDEVNLKVVAISALPSGGSRIAFHSGESVVVQELDANDKLVSGSTVKVPLHDFADIYADKDGFVLLGTRDSDGGGTLNCGNPSNLCGSAPSPAVPCYDILQYIGDQCHHRSQFSTLTDDHLPLSKHSIYEEAVTEHLRLSAIIIVGAEVALLAGSNGVAGTVDCPETPGASPASWFPSFSFNDWNKGVSQTNDTSGSAFGSWPSWFSFNGWNTESPHANGAPGTAWFPWFSFDNFTPGAPGVDTSGSSTEQQTPAIPAAQPTGAPALPAAQTTDAPEIPTAPTTDISETPAAQTTNVPETPAVYPTNAPETPAVQPTSAPETPAPETTDAPATTNSPAGADPPSPDTDASAAAAPSAASNSSTTTTSSDNSKLCAKPRVRITEVDLGVTVDANEDEVNLKVVAISALPSGGSRIAFHSGESVVVQELDANDKLVSGSTVKVPLHDFADIYADKDGFVLLGTRDSDGGGTLNCGNPSNLCGSAPSPAVPCYDMYLS